VSRQIVRVNQHDYQNVRATFGDSEGPRLIIGAHYDAHRDTPGADDNASGVAGLIELAYRFGETPPKGTVELVAYTLEEPPFFGSKEMGSYLHARETRSMETEVIGVIVLEMIGYFSDEPGSQDYPSPIFQLIYPNKGNFIGVVGKLEHRAFTKSVKAGMKGATDLPVYSVNAPAAVPGIDYSDHRNYWRFGYEAVMVTNTAFYRNKAYHTPEDTWERLDYERMAKVVIGVESAARKLLHLHEPAK